MCVIRPPIDLCPAVQTFTHIQTISGYILHFGFVPLTVVVTWNEWGIYRDEPREKLVCLLIYFANHGSFVHSVAEIPFWEKNGDPVPYRIPILAIDLNTYFQPTEKLAGQSLMKLIQRDCQRVYSRWTTVNRTAAADSIRHRWTWDPSHFSTRPAINICGICVRQYANVCYFVTPNLKCVCVFLCNIFVLLFQLVCERECV